MIDLNGNYNMKKSGLCSYELKMGYIKYYYANGPYFGDPVTDERVHIISTGKGFSTGTGGGASWMCLVSAKEIKHVHEDLIKCVTYADLYAINKKWGCNDPITVSEDECLIAVPLIFELRVRGAQVTKLDKKVIRTCHVYNARDLVPVEISTIYRVLHNGVEYLSTDYVPYVPIGSDNMDIKQSLVVSTLQQILYHILKGARKDQL